MVILFLADGFEEIEALTPLDLLRRAGVETVTVGLGGREIRGSHGITVLADTDTEHMPTGPIDMVILPGGMPGAANLDASVVVADTLSRAAQSNAYLAAICAAPMVLGHKGYLAGKRATCFPGFEEELLGATVVPDGVVRDGHIITARGMGVALDFGLTLVAALKGEEVAASLRAAVQAP
ncbi:MAG: DJ-1/PfpI family protein [Ruminococcaceae bacterium]|nr:DJ-1/PfpI family protein [Oscillospiraceae bacterium]MBE6793246.1 DJ-1/PfpI family protein [Oscillospiraceae bacterium]